MIKIMKANDADTVSVYDLIPNLNAISSYRQNLILDYKKNNNIFYNYKTNSLRESLDLLNGIDISDINLCSSANTNPELKDKMISDYINLRYTSYTLVKMKDKNLNLLVPLDINITRAYVEFNNIISIPDNLINLELILKSKFKYIYENNIDVKELMNLFTLKYVTSISIDNLDLSNDESEYFFKIKNNLKQESKRKELKNDYNI